MGTGHNESRARGDISRPGRPRTSPHLPEPPRTLPNLPAPPPHLPRTSPEPPLSFPLLRYLLRALVTLLALTLLLTIGGGCYLRSTLRASLPVLEGQRTATALAAPVTIARDALGVPTLTGGSRADVALALGFLHAQDRFFQMDLQRRQAAGELSALVGPRAVDVDRRSRLHRFRVVAQQAYAHTAPEWRAVLDAYAAGVNAGLTALGRPPFEYTMLGAVPDAWQPEDSILTILAMFSTLQGRQPAFEQTVQQMRSSMPEPLVRFLTAAGSEWDALAEGTLDPRPGIPGPDVLDLRAAYADRPPVAASNDTPAPCARLAWHRGSAPWCNAGTDADLAASIGSNNWAVDGARSANGGALVANDMHLDLGVPNIWYRASMVFPDPADPITPIRLTGVTLPGLPNLVVGSNGFVAWGFTNAGGDWSDLVRIEADPQDARRYLTPGGPLEFELIPDEIAVRGEASLPVTLRWTIWGPIVWTDAAGREYAQRWVAHDPDVLSSDITRPERVRTVDELLLAAAGLGIPNQNFAVADSTGRIGWTVGGVIPRRTGLDGFTPESWADGTRRWDGYLDVADYPRIVDPEGGRLWTANSPVVDGARLALLGDGGYADGIRARMIRDRLRSIERATPADMLSVQLEDGARFLDRWRTLALDTLGTDAAREAAGARGPARQEFRRLVETTWTGRASPDSAAYLLVRTFRAAVVRAVMSFVTRPALDADPAFDYRRSPRSEGPVWQIVAGRPAHLLPPEHASWDALLVAAVDEAIDELTADDARGGHALADRTWGEANRVRIVHPLASAVPFIDRWLNMPPDALPGDVFTPRAQSPRTGPSERMVVSPGREAEGILHMPTGQSAHPLSPHFGDMHRAWVDGTPVPFLPGPPVHVLTLVP